MGSINSFISLNRMDEHLYKIQQSLFESAHKSTTPLFHNNRPEWPASIPELVRTGMLIELNGACYIITATHVVHIGQRQILQKQRTARMGERGENSSDIPVALLSKPESYRKALEIPKEKVINTGFYRTKGAFKKTVMGLFSRIESYKEESDHF